MNSEMLLNDLIERTKNNLNHIERLKKLNLKELNYRKSSDSWSKLECIEHLNLYGDYYLPQIEKSIKNSKHNSKPFFKPGILGNYFVNLMKTNKKVKKMKTAKEMNPIESKLDSSSLDRFIFQQQKMLQLIEKTRKIDLTKNTTPVSISKLIKLRVGDTLRFVVTHNERHIRQANNIIVE